jgi:hypothetical protein
VGKKVGKKRKVTPGRESSERKGGTAAFNTGAAGTDLPQRSLAQESRNRTVERAPDFYDA